ncbi:hypothetical protein DFH08DRAFT_905668 [Mycena albidolilacea]|uniref:Uncharacterized protein n=1 Tax=Mycena albidolilacea TaxID=1033008 RepID=A0AAD6YZC9_9AGAR|nr:hypothetical protein DFH08DRAFT_905668 [Mycena albidolilacea]
MSNNASSTSTSTFTSALAIASTQVAVGLVATAISLPILPTSATIELTEVSPTIPETGSATLPESIANSTQVLEKPTQSNSNKRFQEQTLNSDDSQPIQTSNAATFLQRISLGVPNDNELISVSSAETVSQRIPLGGGRDRVPRAAADDVALAANVTPYESAAPVITTLARHASDPPIGHEILAQEAEWEAQERRWDAEWQVEIQKLKAMGTQPTNENQVSLPSPAQPWVRSIFGTEYLLSSEGAALGPEIGSSDSESGRITVFDESEDQTQEASTPDSNTEMRDAPDARELNAVLTGIGDVQATQLESALLRKKVAWEEEREREKLSEMQEKEENNIEWSVDTHQSPSMHLASDASPALASPTASLDLVQIVSTSVYFSQLTLESASPSTFAPTPTPTPTPTCQIPPQLSPPPAPAEVTGVAEPDTHLELLARLSQTWEDLRGEVAALRAELHADSLRAQPELTRLEERVKLLEEGAREPSASSWTSDHAATRPYPTPESRARRSPSLRRNTAAVRARGHPLQHLIGGNGDVDGDGNTQMDVDAQILPVPATRYTVVAESWKEDVLPPRARKFSNAGRMGRI